MHCLLIVFTGYWLIVYLGIKWIEYQTFGKIDCDNFPGWLAAVIHTIFFVGCLEAGILYILAIPLASFATLLFCQMIRRYFVTRIFYIFLCSFYLTI